MKKIYVFIMLFIVFTTFSCSNDNFDLKNQIIGEWKRSDFRDNFEYKLIFNSDESGFKTVRIGTMETTITSSIVTFNWKIDDNWITFTENDEVIKTPISFSDKDQLILKDYSELPFHRIK